VFGKHHADRSTLFRHTSLLQCREQFVFLFAVMASVCKVAEESNGVRYQIAWNLFAALQTVRRRFNYGEHCQNVLVFVV
jgi:hypothetical protein